KTDGMDILGVRFATPLVDGYARPLVVTPESPEIEIPASGPYLRLHFLGHVTAPGGHPVEGAVGDTAASYTVRYTAGRTVEVPLRNGIEIAAGNIIDGATRIDPVATPWLNGRFGSPRIGRASSIRVFCFRFRWTVRSR